MTGANTDVGVFKIDATLPTNALMKQLPEIVFKFKLTGSGITFNDSNNASCSGSCCGYTLGVCTGGYNCHACSSNIAATSVTQTFTVTWKNVCLAEVFVLPTLREDIVY